MGAHRKARRAGRTQTVIAVVALLTGAALMWDAQSSFAVHDTGMFELEGNIVHDGATTPPYDWASLFGAGGARLTTPDPVNGPLLADAFVDDQAAGDTSYFAGGTKIDDQIHNMGCGGPAANDKTSIDFVYAALVLIPANAPDNGGHQVLYLGVEKQAGGAGGDNAFGFWLFKDAGVGCSGTTFSGHHTDGDLFIDGTFTNGGGASDVEVFRWNGDDTTGSISAAPIAQGAVCGGAASDNVCGIANSAAITSGAWRSSGTNAANTFVEAGIDMTTVLGPAGGCFTNFMADSQSSQDTNSQPKDFAAGQLDTCIPPTVGTTATPGGSINPLGVSTQHDVATITATGGRPDPTGTMTFFLCNPAQLTNSECETGGTQVGGDVTIVNGSATSANASGTLTTTVGKYCWRSEYTPDTAASAFYSATTHTDQSTECFSTVKNTTGIVTAATGGTIGDAVHDVATLSGATADAGGTITFQAWGPSITPDCSGSAVFTSTVGVNSNGDYTSADFTPSTAGTYYWIASYSGDAKNLPSTGTCGDDGESSPIGRETTLIGTAASSETVGAPVHDVATLSGATAGAGGTITFNAFGPSDTPDCSGDPVFTDTVDVNGPGEYTSGDFTPTTAGNYYWIATYSGDVNNLPSGGSCGDEGETSTIGKQTTLIGTAASSQTIGAPIHDVATLSGATADAGGTITFNAYGPSDTPDCSGTVVFTDTVDVNGPGDYQSADFTPTVAGSYYWIATYSGDVNNLASGGACGDDGETSEVGKATTLIGTAASSQQVGAPIHDIATLSGATGDAGGTITFNLYGPSSTPDCSGTPVFSTIVAVTGNGHYTSGNFVPTKPGSYYWIAAYSGDGNNQPSTGACGDEGETSTVQAAAVEPEPPLANTGVPVQGEMIVAFLVMGLGLVLLVSGRRREIKHQH